MSMKMVDGTKLDASLEATADAIRVLKGGADPIHFDMDHGTGFSTAIITEDEGYITFSSAESFTLSNYTGKKTWFGKLEYSKDKETWTEWRDDDHAEFVSEVSSAYDGEKYVLYLRGTDNAIISAPLDSGSYLDEDPVPFVLTGSDISCTGNIEMLLDYRIACAGMHPAMGKRCFCRLFYGCAALVEAPRLPAPILSKDCYEEMFLDCTGLTASPELPAMSLAHGCYSGMFKGCTGLLTAPELPALYIARRCYENMFEGCTALEEAPELPATDFGGYGLTNCYSGMFKGCTALTKAPALPAPSPCMYAYAEMFSGCASLAAIPEIPALSINMFCCQSMFDGCYSVLISETQTEECPYEYRIPSDGTGTADYGALTDMFANTGGDFTGSPSLNTTYYTNRPPVPAV